MAKFTIVTPSYNSQRFIRETIESVINQKGDFEIEYIVVDNCSTDQTRQIVEEYIDLLESGKFLIKCQSVHIKFVSGKDLSMYEAIQKGFLRATGDIYAWINSDDIYLSGAFEVIKQTFSDYPQIQWVKGITSFTNEKSTIFAVGNCNLYSQDLIRKGLYGTIMCFIEQDSVFWSPELWELSGSGLKSYSAAGDFALWRNFAKIAPLYSLKSYVSCFRVVSGQKSENMKAYWQEINDYEQIIKEHKLVSTYLSFEARIPQKLRPLSNWLIFGRQSFYLVILKNNITPYLREGSYHELRKYL